MSLDLDLGAAALPDLEVAARGLSDDDVVGPGDGAHGAGGHSFEALLLHHARHADLPCEIAVAIGGEPGHGLGERGDGALHIGGSAAVDAAVCDARLERGIGPLLGVLGGHGVDMAVEQDRRAGALGVDSADHAAVPVDDDLIVAQRAHLVGQHGCCLGLLPGIAFRPDKIPAEFDQSGGTRLVHRCSLRLRGGWHAPMRARRLSLPIPPS